MPSLKKVAASKIAKEYVEVAGKLDPRQAKLLDLILTNPLGMDQIFEWIADGESLDKIASLHNTTRFVLYSLLHAKPEWKAKLQLARKAAADKFAEEVVRIADMAQIGEERLANTRIEARKWTASVYDPERFTKNNSAVNVNIQELHLAAIQSLEKTLRKENYEEDGQIAIDKKPKRRRAGGLD